MAYELASAGASLLGGMMANSANKKIAREQMAFQERMSSTAYQRATADMRAAGLNPMLAYQQGGSSAPQGASATMQDVVTPAVNSARTSSKVSEEVKNLQRTNRLINAQIGTAQTQSDLNIMNTNKAKADAILAANSAKKIQSETRLTDAALPAALNAMRVEQSPAGATAAEIDRTTKTLKPIVDIVFGNGKGGR